ncbi:MAG: NGG1p interacting factor NIF3 [Omnitrophica bacterium]|nr:NGG1p interacting factor NIF3 [Candidatus Omnitrophota bacterium]
MTLQEIYEFVVKRGLTRDPRTKKELEEEKKRIRLEYSRLKKEDRVCFDKELLIHPYADTRILNGNRKTKINTIMVGIDIGGEELLAAYLLNEKGAGIDLALSHHPSGRGLANLSRVMHIHTDVLVHLGIDKKIAHSLMKERIGEVERRLLPANHERSTDMARLLGMPFMCVHTPADNHVAHFLQCLFDRKKPKKIKNVLEMLKTIPEYKDGACKGAGPQLIAGKEDKKPGKIFVDMTGGTEGSKKIFARLSQAGVSTIVAMHLGEEHFKIAKMEFMNVIIAGHIASDNLGMNLVLDELRKKHTFNIIPCSGFVRVKR